MSIVQKDGHPMIEFTGELFKLQVKDQAKKLLEREHQAKKTIMQQIEKFTKSGNTFKLTIYQGKLKDCEEKITNLEKVLQ